MRPIIIYVEITYFPANNSIRYSVEKSRESNKTETGFERYSITYNQNTVPKTIINYISKAKYALNWDTITDYKECVVSNSMAELEHIQNIYSKTVKYFTNFTIEER